ncbi:DegQ family serine endoprotease [Marinimicrococcus flavescens]|uniref:Probable periplasmic serine endoprotease DegP-like n=1 Tax=Marinimicrococcus flavescens TaxID=3031815 RepID=A0AAP4D4Z1_9PROT|nr:DegQ family serine endoprotease [Marinimicrococcus flavescens]
MVQFGSGGRSAARPRALGRLVAARLLAAVLAAGVLAQDVVAQPGPPGFADLVDRVAPAVVNVSTRKAIQGRDEPFPMPQVPPGSPFEEFFKEFFDREREQQMPRRTFSLGSGFIIDPQGFVVTNNHVIADADEISVLMSDDREFPATLVGRDTKTDLALLKIESPKPLPYLEWADSDAVRVGDWMLAIGNPFGLGSSVTAGIVSARGRDIRSGPYDDFIQVDAAINRGNSGGPSFTLEGTVFGVNTAIFSPSGGNVGIGFAIPANLAKPVIDSIKATGRVSRGWLGVRIQSVTEEIAEGLGLEDSEGALVASVTPGGPAANSAIEAGDVILEFNGHKIDRMRNLPRIVAETPVGEKVPVVVWRRGERQSLEVVLGELPEDEQLAELGAPQVPDQAAPSAEIPELGLTVAALDDELRARFGLPEDARGVVIVEVANNGPAAQENLRAGDLVVEVGQEEVSAPAELVAKVAEARQQDKRAALLLIDRQGDLRFVAVRFKE